jgi:hypothetical protein
VLGFSFLLSLLKEIVFGVAPAWLMVQTLRNLQDQQFGFEMEGNVVVDVNAGFGGYAPEKLAAVYREIERRLRQIPGVRDASLALYSPMSGMNWQSGVTLEERPERMVSPSWDRVSPAFFSTIGARLLRGRVFDDRDTPDSTHVAVVTQAFADSYFPNENPLGKRFGFGAMENRANYQIVGVVNNIVFRNPRQPAAPPMFFLPLLQMWNAEWDNTFGPRCGRSALRREGVRPARAGRWRNSTRGMR